MKKSVKRLALNRDTIQTLNLTPSEVAGGAPTDASDCSCVTCTHCGTLFECLHRDINTQTFMYCA